MVHLSETNRPLGEVLASLSRQTGMKFVPVGEAGERTVTVQLERAPLPEALRQLRVLARCAFVRFAGGYFAVPLFSPEELQQRLAKTPHPERLAGILSLEQRTGWGWQRVTVTVHFQAPDRLLADSPFETLWTEGERMWRWDKRRDVVVEGATPLLDWTESLLGVAAVPAFGHGWRKLSPWLPTEMSATLLKGRPVWVLTLTRQGQLPFRPTFTFLRVTLANTMYAPYLEPAPVAWQVRCFVDCETQSVVRREVYDPQGRPLQVVSAEPLTDKPLPLIAHRFEVLDAGLTVVGRGEWRPEGMGTERDEGRGTRDGTERDEGQRMAGKGTGDRGLGADDFSPPNLPAEVLRSDAPIARQLAQAEQVWLHRDDGATALQLVRQAVTQTDHPAALVAAASLLARLNRPEEAWQCLQKMREHLWRFAEATTLAVQLAGALGRWGELRAWLQEQAERPSLATWMALASLAEVEAWQQEKWSDEPMGWYARVLRHMATTLSANGKERTILAAPEERAMAWTAAQRLFTWAWAMGRTEQVMALGRELLGTPAEPIGRALLAWGAMEREDDETACEHLRQLRERFADWTALRLAMAELAESYGLTSEAESEYRRLLSEVPMTPEGLRVREHWLRRLVETDQAEEAVRFFLDSLSAFRDDWAKSQWAETFREIATTALRHNRIANLAEAWWQRKTAHPERAWLCDLMARFCESEDNLEGALEWLHQATLTYPRMPIFAARWCQEVLRLHLRARRGGMDEKTAEKWRQLAGKRVAWMDERLRAWRRQFTDQPFFSWLFVFAPNLLSAYANNPAVTRQLAREFLRRAKEMAPPSEAERRLLEALMLLNYPANWLDQPAQIRLALLRLEQVEGAQWHGLRMLARQLFATFNGVQPDLRVFLPFLDRAMDSCWDETERIAIAQSALQTLIARQQWREAIFRLHRWLQLSGSDLYRRSLLLGWRNALTPLAADEQGREVLSQVMGLMPDDAFGWVLRAETWEVVGGTDKAKQAYEQALQRLGEKENAHWLWQLYGEAALRWGNTELAEQALKRAMGQAPVWERVMLWLQARTQGERLPDEGRIRRLIAHFGWRWQLLSLLAGAVNNPRDAFRWVHWAERLATMDATASRLQKFLLRVNLARLAGQTGRRKLAQFWLERLRQPEAPEEIQTAADEVAKQLP